MSPKWLLSSNSRCVRTCFWPHQSIVSVPVLFVRVRLELPFLLYYIVAASVDALICFESFWQLRVMKVIVFMGVQQSG
jgi:hypothetical protein